MDDPELYRSSEDSQENSFSKPKESIDFKANIQEAHGSTQHKLEIISRGTSAFDEMNLKSDPSRISHRLDLVKLNSAHGQTPKESFQPHKESTFRKSSMKSSILPKDLNMSMTKKESQDLFYNSS